MAEARTEQERQRALTEARWQEALAIAHEQAVLAYRHATISATLNAWRDAADLREICDVLRRFSPHQPTRQPTDLELWIAWALEHADEIDPTMTGSGLAATPFDFTPGPDDLRPHLNGWSPERPEKEKRADAPLNAGSGTQEFEARYPWHPGLRDKPAWWRHRSG